MEPARLIRFLSRRFVVALVAVFTLGAGTPALGQRAGGPGLTPSTPSPILDGMTPVFWLAGSDPTVAPGLDLPIGSIARTSPSSAGPFYFTKVGFGATEWQIVQGQAPGVSGAPLIVGGAAGTRYYCVDYDSGSDSRRGYVDAQTGSTLTTCTSVAVKTLLRLRALLPAYGNGRSTVLLIKPRAAGATYRNAANTADEGLDLTGVSGYTYFAVRASDLTNSASDHVTLGGMVALAGPNGDSSWTVAAAGASTSGFSVNAGSLGSTDANVGFRFRFDPATATVALRNVSCFINANTSTAITCGGNIAAVPSTGTLDTGFIERPGLRMKSFAAPMFQPAIVAGVAVASTTFGALSLSGGIFSNTFGSLASGSGGNIVFTEQVGTTSTQVIVARTLDRLDIVDSYTDEGGASRSVGMGLRASSAFSVLVPGTVSLTAAAFMNASANVIMTLGIQSNPVGSRGSYFAKGPSITVRGGTASSVIVGTTSATDRKTRFALGPLTLTGSGGIQNADVSNSASSGIVLLGTGSQVTLTTVTGTANTTFGVDASALVGSNVKIASDCTLTGTSGDIKLAGGAAGAIADLSLTNVIDVLGNNVQGAAGTLTGPALLVSNQSGGALAVGHVVRTNGTTGQVTCLQGDTAAHAKVAAGVMVTAPASAALGYMVTTGVPYVLYDGAPTVGAQVFASTGTACKATTTLPAAAATNQCLSLGANLTASASTGYTAFVPSQLPIVATGAACR